MKTDFIKITKGITQIIEIWEPKLTSLEKEVITERRNKQNRKYYNKRSKGDLLYY